MKIFARPDGKIWMTDQRMVIGSPIGFMIMIEPDVPIGQALRIGMERADEWYKKQETATIEAMEQTAVSVDKKDLN